jgi:acyl-CoA hydrolase
VHVTQATFFVEFEQDVPALPAPQPNETDLKIGDFIATLVEDGSTIQLGIGGIPNAAALALKGKHDLGVHTEMLVDSVMELAELGVINNARKAFKKGKFITTFAMGSRKLYDWLDDNVAVEFQRGSWVNNPATVAQNSRMVSINTCLSIDFTGQVSSESIGAQQYSGTGGQSDTAQGAVAGLDGLGKSLIACYSTAKNGTLSTIVPTLANGSAVTLHRSFVDHVVTEHGVVQLRGRTVRERTLALISIADPKFRDELLEQAKVMRYL